MLLGEARVSLRTPPTADGEGDFIGFVGDKKAKVVFGFYWPDASIHPTIVKMELYRFLNTMTVLRELTRDEKRTLWEGVREWQEEIRAGLPKSDVEPSAVAAPDGETSARKLKEATANATKVITKALTETKKTLASTQAKVAEQHRTIASRDTEIKALKAAAAKAAAPAAGRDQLKLDKLQDALDTAKGEVKALKGRVEVLEGEEKAVAARFVIAEENRMTLQRQYDVEKGKNEAFQSMSGPMSYPPYQHEPFRQQNQPFMGGHGQGQGYRWHDSYQGQSQSQNPPPPSIQCLDTQQMDMLSRIASALQK